MTQRIDSTGYLRSLGSKHTFQSCFTAFGCVNYSFRTPFDNWLLARFCKKEALRGAWKQEGKQDSSCFQFLSGLLEEQQQTMAPSVFQLALPRTLLQFPGSGNISSTELAHCWAMRPDHPSTSQVASSCLESEYQQCSCGLITR